MQQSCYKLTIYKDFKKHVLSWNYTVFDLTIVLNKNKNIYTTLTVYTLAKH